MTQEEKQKAGEVLSSMEKQVDNLYGTAPMPAQILKQGIRALKKLLGILIITGALYGCRTSYRPVSDAEIRAAELERRVGETVERLEEVAAEAEGIGERINRIIFLFDEYDKCVRELIEYYRELEGKTVVLEKNDRD